MAEEGKMGMEWAASSLILGLPLLCSTSSSPFPFFSNIAGCGFACLPLFFSSAREGGSLQRGCWDFRDGLHLRLKGYLLRTVGTRVMKDLTGLHI